ncbi:MAG: sulfotransferase, partial [Deltaproteobacteria bacterium]|nr:sulfotransferase [Deltaproteobacteria bacterium]
MIFNGFPATPPGTTRWSATEKTLSDAPTTALVRKDVTIQRLEHHTLEKLANLGLTVSEWLNLPFTRIDAESVIREAKRKTGLDDVGDTRFLEPMKKVMEQVADFDRYTPLARGFIHTVCVRQLVHRLQIEQWFKDHPETADIPIERPIFVLGFPRTGTTVLQNMLEQAPHRRALQFWETTSPIPWHDDLEKDRAA